MIFASHRLVPALLVATLLASTAAAASECPASVKAIVLEAAGGARYAWKETDLPLPALGARDVLVRVKAVSLNRGDIEALDGEDPRPMAGKLALSDAAGIIVDTGVDAHAFAAGDAVVTSYFPGWQSGPLSRELIQRSHSGADRAAGVFAECLVLPESSLMRMPKSLSFEEGASLPTAALTAYAATVAGSGSLHGRRVLTQGTGGVSVFALQFALAAGAEVIATTSSEQKAQWLLAHGATQAIDYKANPEWSKQVLAATGGKGVDLVVDVAGKASLAESVKSLAWEGRLALVGGLTGYDGSIPAGSIISKRAHVEGIFVGPTEMFDAMAAFIDAKRIKPVITVFDYGQRDEAARVGASGSAIGKVVIRYAGR